MVCITEEGFEPAKVKVGPGSPVEWVNLDLDEHTMSGAGFDSGVLAPGQRYRAGGPGWQL